MSCVPRLNILSKPKDPPYPIDVPVLVKFSYWRRYRNGTIIRHSKRDKTIQIPNSEGRRLFEIIQVDDYAFQPTGTTDTYQLNSLAQVKLVDGTDWSTEYRWYTPKHSYKIIDGVKSPVTITLVPVGLPTSLEEAMNKDKLAILS